MPCAWAPVCTHVHVVCACGVYGVLGCVWCARSSRACLCVCHACATVCCDHVPLPGLTSCLEPHLTKLSLTLGLATQGKTLLDHVWGLHQACDMWHTASMTQGDTVEKCPPRCWNWEWLGSEAGFTCGFLARVLGAPLITVYRLGRSSWCDLTLCQSAQQFNTYALG